MTRPPVIVIASVLPHMIWGVVVWWAPLVALVDLQPVLVMAWVGTSTMLLIAALVVGSQGWPRTQIWVFPALLVLDLAAAGLVFLAA